MENPKEGISVNVEVSYFVQNQGYAKDATVKKCSY